MDNHHLVTAGQKVVTGARDDQCLYSVFRVIKVPRVSKMSFITTLKFLRSYVLTKVVRKDKSRWQPSIMSTIIVINL